jgi:hypothetical protein
MCLAVLLLTATGSLFSFATGEVMRFRLGSSDPTPEIGTTFDVFVELYMTRTSPTTHIYLPMIRVPLFYDTDRFEPATVEMVGEQKRVTSVVGCNEAATGDLVASDLTGKYEMYPADVDAVKRPTTGMILINWEAVFDGGTLGAFDSMATTTYRTVFQVTFRVKDTAPLTGGEIALNKMFNAPGQEMLYYNTYVQQTNNYGGGVTPSTWSFGAMTSPTLASYATNLVLTDAKISVTPRSHPPQLTPGANSGLTVEPPSEDREFGYIYGFPQILTQPGSPVRWVDPQEEALKNGQTVDEFAYAAAIQQYIAATNDGKLKITNQSKAENKGEYGTETILELYDSGKVKAHGKYKFVVFGDVDGNFVINLDDYQELRMMLAEQRAAKFNAGASLRESAYHFAAKASSTGTSGAVNAADLAAVYAAAVGLTDIVQTRA